MAKTHSMTREPDTQTIIQSPIKVRFLDEYSVIFLDVGANEKL